MLRKLAGEDVMLVPPELLRAYLPPPEFAVTPCVE
jgi:hypothetical protein